ncbi:mannose-1-phosphate guanylyltransferase/mannose-6-phosphate isomerase [Helicobacter sp. 11S02629-2]|uniref:mannose-1-phosphate guanylyltransferase/mannose-6-phosphate isomerase n=1 Tax=Helicobacter sp. 11S02629-2 TaxID=1476195 RepID=UPI000BA7D2E5|nr:mannose-1-phosphate guanylyltransferase/mannose-6-phosphate isomerase [Helicobacter sp. 11S02629-2]PAF44965.1 mannose-1-phosphate guanylyltransferase/mannose-6-phosphate isomerase [Helicobacter sp. 11S02629-2]
MIVSILCGGSGTRLWPISRTLMPKQFANLLKEGSLFELTLKRNAPLLKDPFFEGKSQSSLSVVTNDKHYFLALNESSKVSIKIDFFLLESLPKNTAPALLFQALSIYKNLESLDDLEYIEANDEIILALPSDHLIKDESKYIDCVKKAYTLASKGYIATFGITPSSPNTGYGYIEVLKDSKEKDLGFKVKSFHEKPSLEVAKSYIVESNYYWNSGMFCFKASTLIKEAKLYCNDMLEACFSTLKASLKEANFIRLDEKASKTLKDLSIDYAIMEKSKNLYLVESSFTWSDVGSFDSLSNEWKSDGNKTATNTTLEAINSSSNFILSNKLVATIGLKDYIVIDTNDALLIAKKGESQDVKDIVSRLKKTNKELTFSHSIVHRPWGSYSVLLEDSKFKLKSIIVKPGQRLSLQRHNHRNEHWIVVSGSALVQIEHEEMFLAPNQSTYIPMGKVHRLSNMGKIDLVIIEVQVGEYLGEDDIVRIEDDYKR